MIEALLGSLESTVPLEGVKAELTTKDIEFAHDYLQQNPEALDKLKERIEVTAMETCDFFGLPKVPVVEGDSICVWMTDLESNSKDIFEYNPDQFAALKCTSYEDISKVWAHECGHRILRDIYPESWTAELGSDVFSGARSEMLGLPTGNFEKFLEKEPPSLSHPGGALRVQAMQFGRELVAEMCKKGIAPTWESILEAFDESPFSKIVYKGNGESTGSVAAFVDDKSYHIDCAKDAKSWADWHDNRAKEAIQRGDLSSAKDHAQKAQSYERKAEEELKIASKCSKLVNAATTPDVEEIKKTGGSYGELKAEGWGWKSEPPREIHHMPSNESSTLETNDGPSIVMEYDDHRETASCGNSRDAQEYRAEQKRLISEGKFRDALQMDIDDIHDKFGDKYDDSINQMMEYVNELEEEKRI